MNQGTKNVFAILGARNFAVTDREQDDYYATPPEATEWIVLLEKFNKNIWEPACGGGHMSEILSLSGYNVKSTDLVDRGYGTAGIDFLEQTEIWNGDIVTNPPYKYAQEFCEKALSLVPEGNKVAMLLRLNFLEGIRRRKLFDESPPKRVYVSSSRISCSLNADFEAHHNGAIAHAWFVWEKGFKGDTTLKWFN